MAPPIALGGTSLQSYKLGTESVLQLADTSTISTTSISSPGARLNHDSSDSRPLGGPVQPPRKPPPPPMQLPARNSSAIARKPLFSPPSVRSPIEDANWPRSRSPGFDIDAADGVLRSKTIFKELEDYIVRTYGAYESLNLAFRTPQSRPRGPAHSEDNARDRKPHSPPEQARGFDATLSEMDAKTLLLGDVAENGLWWTGRDGRADAKGSKTRRDRSPTHGDDIVHSRSPRIDFAELGRWYQLVIRAGEGWSEIWTRCRTAGQANAKTERPLEEEYLEIQRAFAEARAHLHRTLLKVSENTLKRPGRPLRTPSDIRFLLILLVNPLLYPPTVSPLAGEVAREARLYRRADDTAGNPQVVSSRRTKSGTGKVQTSSAWEQGHAFGIIKRILGLLSNLPNESHRFLTAWFTRYNKNEFRQVLDLVQGFITHRLGRQPPSKGSNTNPEPSLIPGLSGASAGTSAQLHAALGLAGQVKGGVDGKTPPPFYSTDWQVKAAARVMALLFAANKTYHGESSQSCSPVASREHRDGKHYSQFLSTAEFYNTMADYTDLIADFDTWESAQGRFSFCQYPFLLSVGAKIRIMEHDARRQMEVKAREAFFNSILRNKPVGQYLTLRVRRECLVEDSLKSISEVVGAGQEDIKKGLKVQFIDEEGIDAGGLRKEWFLLLVREIFEPQHGNNIPSYFSC